MTLPEATQKLAEAAVSLEMETGYPAEVSMAQAALETGWLRHCPENNPFGIKSITEHEPRQLLQTTEWFTDDQLGQWLNRGDGRRVITKHHDIDGRGRQKYTVLDWFRSFHSMTEAFAIYAEKLQRGRYGAGWKAYQQHRDPLRLIDAIAAAGYATDGSYAKLARSIATGSRAVNAIAAERLRRRVVVS